MNAPASTGGKLTAVEAIRGLACLQVVLSHLALVFWPWLHAFWGVADPVEHPVQRAIHDAPFGALYSGSTAVYVFFVLSGFILTHVAVGRSPRDIAGLVLKRYPRLALPVLASCLFAFALISLVSVDMSDLSVWIQGYGDFDSSLPGAIRNALWDAFVTGESRYNPVLWTMRIELLGSWLVFALCLALTRWPRHRPAWLAITAIAIALAGAWHVTDTQMTLGLASFIVGAAIQQFGRPVRTGPMLLVLAAGLYLAGVHVTSASYAWMHALGDGAYEGGNFIAGALLVFALVNNAGFARWSTGRVPLFLGKVSFAVYLVHLAVIANLGVGLFDWLYQVRDWDYDAAAGMASVVSIVGAYAVATAFHTLVDAPSITLSNRFREWVLPRKQ